MKKIAMILTMVLGLSVSAFADNGQMDNAQISALKQKNQEMRQQNKANHEQIKANREQIKEMRQQEHQMRQQEHQMMKQQNPQNNFSTTQK